MKRCVLLSGLATLLAGCFFGAQLGEQAKMSQPTQRETTRDVLVGTQPEGEGYGLYSYLLFGSPPLPATRERYLRTIMAYLETIPPRTESERYIPDRWQLNITYLPLTDPPPAEFTRPAGQMDLSAAAEWMLQHYNYARARALLRLLPGTHNSGPYLVSQLKPLSGNSAVVQPYLWQDLSHVQPDLVQTWIREFMAQAAAPQFWEPRAVPQFALQLRNAIAVAAAEVPDIQAGLKTWIRTE